MSQNLLLVYPCPQNSTTEVKLNYKLKNKMCKSNNNQLSHFGLSWRNNQCVDLIKNNLSNSQTKFWTFSNALFAFDHFAKIFSQNKFAMFWNLPLRICAMKNYNWSIYLSKVWANWCALKNFWIWRWIPVCFINNDK